MDRTVVSVEIVGTRFHQLKNGGSMDTKEVVKMLNEIEAD